MSIHKNKVGSPSNNTLLVKNIKKILIITFVTAIACYLIPLFIELILFDLLGMRMSENLVYVFRFIMFKLPVYIIIIGLLTSIIIICIKKTKEGKLKLKHYLIIVFLLILVIIIHQVSNKTYTYNDNHKYSPSSTYKIRINKITKVLHAKVHINCISKDCTPQTYNYSLRLTNNEYKKINKLWDDKEHLSLALFYIRDNDKILYNSYNEYKDEYYCESCDDADEYDDVKELDYYNKMDSNSDGKVTRREFANKYMDDILNEK